ncbi:MAG: serine/threonine-protein kinase [bacterium]|nr:MAG: serine/threonine-protein kinase [bacterium]
MIGKTISHYEILEELGEGGMGVVYRARDTALDRDIALKFLPFNLTRDPAAKTRFLREARAASALDHPNVSTIYEIDETEEGQFFIAMAYYEGEALKERISRGPLPLDDAVNITIRIAQGLSAAHKKDIVHRDIKAANIFLTSSGLVKILDFGLAKLSGVTQLTLPESTLGTVSYMSPEQARGAEVDSRSDVWSLGVVLYEMVTGQLPFRGEFSEAMVYSILNEDPTRVTGLRTGVPLELERIIDKCLAKDAAGRYQHLEDLIVDLNGLRPSLSGEPKLKSPRREGGIQWEHRSLLFWAAGLGWLAAAVFLAILLFRVPASQTPVRLSTLTYSGRDWAPSSSPAGDMIAFASDRDGVSRIWLKQVKGGSEAPITEGPDDLPRFSPDGSQILFVRERGGTRDLYRTSVVGAQPRRILEDVLEADWSPDGTRVAFLRTKPVGEENLGVIGVAEVQTGDEHVLTEVENRVLYGIRWSPDGRRIALSETQQTPATTGYSYINLVNTTSGELTRKALTDWVGPYTASEWGPAGRTILAGQAATDLAQFADFPGQIMEYDIESEARRPLFWSPVKLPFGGRSFSTITVLGTGQIVLDEHIIRSVLIEVSWTGKSDTEPERTLTHGLGRDRQPAFSPDGVRVIFSSNRSGNTDLWIVDRFTGALRQLTDDPAIDFDPVFTPDGEHVLWTSTRSGNPEIWMAAADGSRARQVTNDGVDAENPTMTVDGKWIVYGSFNDEKLGIWKIRPDGSEETLLAAGSYILPEVSPDGRYALFSCIRGINRVMRVAEIESCEMVPFEIELPRRMLYENIVLGRARWSSDGHAIVFVGQDKQGHFGIYVQDFVPGRDTSGSRMPLAGFSKDFVTESLGVSPDGKYIVISVVSERRSLKLAEHVTLSWWDGKSVE